MQRRVFRVRDRIWVGFGAIASFLLLYFVATLMNDRPDLTQGSESGSVSNVARAELDLSTVPETEKTKDRNTALLDGVHASVEQWPTEAFSEKAAKLLKELAGRAPFSEGELDEARAATLNQCVVVGQLRPNPLQKISLSPDIEIHRIPVGGGGSVGQHESPLVDSLRELYGDVKTKARCELKIVLVSNTKEGFSTAVHAEGGGRQANAWLQWTAKWNCSWTKQGVLKKIKVEDYEEIRSEGDSRHWFVDSTEQTIGATSAYRNQLIYGMDYWVNRLEHRLFPNRLGHHGLAIADFDGNGLEDLYVCQPGGLPNRLYLHQADGTAMESAQKAGVDVLDDTTAALAVDLDNDGDQDLAILTISGGYLLENDGAGKFTSRMTLPSCRNAFSITAADYDNDGLLDLYVGRYWPDEKGRGAIPLPVPYYDATNGGTNILFRNVGNWKLTDVTEQTGLDVDNTRYTMAAAWEDYDDDGDQDLYVANDFGRNCLYRNDAGAFTNVAAELGVEDTAAGMSVSWADYNHDGRTDLYVGNMFSSAGGRIAYQRQYAERFDDVAQKKLQRLARGNSLFSNLGQNGFSDNSIESATTMGRWAWGSLFADINNDSWDDLLIANGHVTTDDKGDL